MDQNAGSSVARGSISTEQWDVARPLIQRLYMDENRSFSYVANALKVEYGFCPTKRQFDRIVSGKWKLRKNSTVQQRRSAVEQLDSRTMDLDLVHTDVQGITRPLNPSKLKRWQRAMHGNITTTMHSTLPSPTEQTSSSPKLTNHVSPTGTVNDRSAVLEDAVSITEHQDRWEGARLTESPSLTALLSSFYISGSESDDEDMPQVSLAYVDTTCEKEREQGYLFASDMVKLQKRATMWTGALTSDTASYTSVSSLACAPNPSLSRNERIADISIQHRNPYVTISPFHELYIFQDSLQESPDNHGRVECCEADRPWKERLQKLSIVLPHSHTLLTSTMANLALTYREQARFKSAETLHRTLLSTMEETYGFDHHKTLDVHLDLVHDLQEIGLLKDARKILHGLHATIVAGHSHDRDLLCKSMALLANEKFKFGNDEEAEILQRQVVQIQLNLRGPRDRQTAKALANLGKFLMRRRKLCPARKLLRLAVQLVDHASGNTEIEVCKYLNSLAHCYLLVPHTVHRFRDLVTDVHKRLKRVYSEDHPMNIDAMSDFAMYLVLNGEDVQGCDILRDVINRRGPSVDECGVPHPPTLHSMSQLGVILVTLKHFDEAATWFEKSVCGFTALLGVSNRITLADCFHLGYCYVHMGNYHKALSLYEDILDKLSEVEGKFAVAISDFKRLRSYLQWFLADNICVVDLQRAFAEEMARPTSMKIAG